jgi:Anti-sigma factor NepR
MDKPKRRIMKHNLAIQPHQIAPAHRSGRCSIDGRIRAFVNGDSNGEDVLRALYGDVADEPVPDRLAALLRA